MRNINWNKLEPYSGDNKKSFEELCYQIVSEEFKRDIAKGAILTSIDDSGGGDGVEFYLTFPNGDIYGWQAKFFCRLNEGGRKEQIKKSLQTAFKKHPNLKKWYLCSQCNFTPDEKKWFESELKNSKKNNELVLPKNVKVELIHWGESDFINFLRQFIDIHNFFFSEKLFTQEWFNDRYKIDVETSQIKAKYESRIHIPTEIDDNINKLLGGKRLAEILDREIENQQVLMYAKNYKDDVSKLFSENVEDDYKHIQIEIRKLLHDKIYCIEDGITKLEELKQLLLNKDEANLELKIHEFKSFIKFLWNFYNEYRELSESKLCDSIQHIQDKYVDNPQPTTEVLKKKNVVKGFLNFFITPFNKKPNKLSPSQQKRIKADPVENRKREKARDILFSSLYSLKEYAIPSLEMASRAFELIDQNELHISGEAGMGKTHVSFNIYEDQIVNQKQPAIFLFAKNIKTDRSLEEQIKEQLSLPTNLTFDNFMGAIEVAAKTNRIKIPIIIDGLNESTFWDVVWKDGLERLILKIKKYYPHLILITTYRTSYKNQLFPKNYFDYENNEDTWKKRAFIQGFEGLTWDAINNYFEFYKIKLENYSDAIGDFKHPLYLKLFCETKNPKRKNVITVSFQNEDLFEVFDKYIEKANENITRSLKKLNPKYDSDFTKEKLLKLAEYIWENNSRGIPRSEDLFTNEEVDIFESENLLVFRDWNRKKNKEEIQFTYDLLGGYIISKYVIGNYKESFSWLSTKFGNSKSASLGLVKSRKFKRNLLNKETQHPLFNDILRTICILLIKEKKIFLFDVLKNVRAKEYSTESLFEINSRYIRENETLVKQFLENEFFKNDNRKFLFNLAKSIELDSDHPLNFQFWSRLLKELNMAERDLSWSEYIRNNHSWYGGSYFSDFIKNLEHACKENRELTNRVHNAAMKVMWVLTTNINRLRDEATKALYYYARKYPQKFLELLEYSFKINDPYVPERILAVAYGLAMAKQNDFKDLTYKKELLPKYGKFLFDNMFSNDAQYTTTHILARDYAKRTIDIALLHHPDLLSKTEKQKIIYPLKNYPHLAWQESEDKNKKEYRDGNAPIHMDFENYTIGNLINDRRNYDKEHNEYKKVLSNIYWRIYNLGYSLERFGKIDKQIAGSRWNYSHNDDVGKTDRYGKKYSWIAYYEMAGYRNDLDLYNGWDDKPEFRISDVNIDPSFPEVLKEFNIFKELGEDNFLGNLKENAEKWYESDKDFETDKFIHVKSKLGGDNNHEWVALRSSISQKDKKDSTRDIHVAIDAVLVSPEDYEKITGLIKNHSNFSFEYLHQFGHHYMFAGEFPWCSLMADNLTDNFSIKYNKEEVAKTRKHLVVLNNSKELSKNELDKFRKIKLDFLNKVIEDNDTFNLDNLDLPSIDQSQDDLSEALTKSMAQKLGYSWKYEEIPYKEVKQEELNIEIERTIFENLWEDYHSEIIPSGDTKTPSKKICDNLGLFLKPQSSDLYNNNELAATSFRFGEGYGQTSNFAYIRKNYFEQYLNSTNKKVIWLQWMEKRFFPDGIDSLISGNNNSETEYRTHYRIIWGSDIFNNSE